MTQRKAEKWGVNDDSPIDKIKEEAYREGFSAKNVLAVVLPPKRRDTKRS